jgi:hypothetical protein
VSEAPCPIFYVTAHLVDVPLAKAALQSEKTIRRPGYISLELAFQCSLPYLVGFVKIASKYLSSNLQANEPNWKLWAQAFEPVRSEHDFAQHT